MKLIIDAMGGDNAPRAIVRGTVKAMSEFPDISVIITGDREEIGNALAELNFDEQRLEIIHTTQVIDMDDSPVKAIKDKADSSMVVALNMLAKQYGGIMISAGNTGALVAGATLIVKRIPGIKRPALAPVLPSKTGNVMLIDGGANADCKPSYLSQFGVMGSVYMEKVFGIERPKVALVNNGGEAEKGSELTKAAYKLLEKAPIHFVGNAEGRDLLSGEFDVLVTDGFTGNIILKFLEGCASTILGMLKGYIMESAISKIGAALMKNSFQKLKQKMDYSEYGGSLLLGVNGGVMKAHGSSDEKAIYSAVRAARKFLMGDVVNVIKQEIAVLSKTEIEDEGELREKTAGPAVKPAVKKTAQPAPANSKATPSPRATQPAAKPKAVPVSTKARPAGDKTKILPQKNETTVAKTKKTATTTKAVAKPPEKQK